MKLFSVLLAAALLPLAACTPDYSANRYDAAAVQQANKVDRGVIIGRRQVLVSAQGTVGAVTGGAAGGIVGSQAPGGAVSSAFGALGGTLVGGLFGTAAEHATGDEKAWEYIVRQPTGDLLSVTQTDRTPLEIGTSVLVITGKQARIVPDYTMPLPPPSAQAQAGSQARPAQPPPTAEADPPKAPVTEVPLAPLTASLPTVPPLAPAVPPPAPTAPPPAAPATLGP